MCLYLRGCDQNIINVSILCILVFFMARFGQVNEKTGVIISSAPSPPGFKLEKNIYMYGTFSIVCVRSHIMSPVLVPPPLHVAGGIMFSVLRWVTSAYFKVECCNANNFEHNINLKTIQAIQARLVIFTTIM